jgi:hypothetical protein
VSLVASYWTGRYADRLAPGLVMVGIIFLFL